VLVRWVDVDGGWSAKGRGKGEERVKGQCGSRT
jgi:hypothetical protein